MPSFSAAGGENLEHHWRFGAEMPLNACPLPAPQAEKVLNTTGALGPEKVLNTIGASGPEGPKVPSSSATGGENVNIIGVPALF